MATRKRPVGKHRTARRRALELSLKESIKTLRSGVVMIERLKRQLERDWAKVVKADARYLALLERTDPDYGGVGAGDAEFESVPERLCEQLEETLTEQIETVEAMIGDLL